MATRAARAVAYVVDTIVLFTFLAVFAFFAGLQLLIRSDFGDADAPNSAYITILAIAAAAAPLWALFNALLYRWRGQSAGHFVLDIRVERADGQPLTWGTAFARLLALHPLVFHSLLAGAWLLAAGILIAETTSEVSVVVSGAIIILSLIAPFVAAAAVLTDARRRGLHDRVAGTVVVRVERE